MKIAAGVQGCICSVCMYPWLLEIEYHSNKKETVFLGGSDEVLETPVTYQGFKYMKMKGSGPP